MPGWLSGLLGIFTGPLNALWNAVVNVVATVYNWLQQQVDSVYHDVLSAYDYASRLGGYIESFVGQVYNAFVQWVDREFGNVINWASGEIGDVEHYAENVLNWASNAIGAVERWVTGLLNDLRQWVIQDIWSPLARDLSTALTWIGREGAYVYTLLTHPELLAQFLIAYLLSAWLTLTRRYAKPLVAWFLGSWKQFTPDIVSVLEDIISSLF